MPGYLMHLAEGQIILNNLKRMKNNSLFNETNENDFLLGCILPDAVTDKELTHFRPQSQKEQITKYPDMPYVLETYFRYPLSPCDFGILAHLHLDARYVSYFWPKYFTFLDSNESYTNLTSDIDHVKIYSNEQRVPFKQFFSDTWFYGEYDILNPYIYSMIQPRIPNFSSVLPDIQICECESIEPVFIKKILTSLTENLDKADNFTNNQEISPKIFPKEDILKFLDETAEAFIEEIVLR